MIVFDRSKYLLAVTGLPRSAELMLNKIFESERFINKFSYYKWLQWLKEFRFEDVDKLRFASDFLELSGILKDSSKIVLIDGIKTYDQIVHISYATQRYVIEIKVSNRVWDKKNQEYDGWFGKKRPVFLRYNPFFLIDCTGSIFQQYEDSKIHLHYSHVFVESMFNFLFWMDVFPTKNDWTEALTEITTKLAKQQHGYQTVVVSFEKPPLTNSQSRLELAIKQLVDI